MEIIFKDFKNGNILQYSRAIIQLKGFKVGSTVHTHAQTYMFNCKNNYFHNSVQEIQFIYV